MSVKKLNAWFNALKCATFLVFCLFVLVIFLIDGLLAAIYLLQSLVMTDGFKKAKNSCFALFRQTFLRAMACYQGWKKKKN